MLVSERRSLIALEQAMAHAFCCRKAAIFELDMAEVMSGTYLATVDAFLDNAGVKALITEMVDPANIVMTDTGPMFSPAVWAKYEQFADVLLGSALAKELAPSLNQFVASEYRGGLLASQAKLKAGAQFTLVDKQAVGHMTNNNLYWIKEGATRTIEPGIAKVAQDALAQGYGRKDAADILRAALGDKYRVAASRWNVVSSAALNRARNFARIRHMTTYEVTTVVFSAVMDERTTEVCASLDGKTWSLSSAVESVERVEGATTPEQAIDAQPWLSVDKSGQWQAHYSTGNQPINPADLEAMGAFVPPLHGNCRSELLPDFSGYTTVEDQIEDMGPVIAEEQKTPTVKDKRPVSELLTAREQPAAAVAKGYTVAEIHRLTATGAVTGQAVTEQIAWKGLDNSFAMWNRWVTAEAKTLVAEFSTVVTQPAIHITGTAFRQLPGASMQRIADRALALAEAKGVQVSISLPAAATTEYTAVAFKSWKLDGPTQAKFKAWLAETGIMTKMQAAKMGLQPGHKLGQWLRINVDGEQPLLRFFRESSQVGMVYAP